MKKISKTFCLVVLSLLLLCPPTSSADSLVTATVAALQMVNTITGGSMPTMVMPSPGPSAVPTMTPAFASMVSYIQGGDYVSAAKVVVNSPYFSKFLVERIAGEMQTPMLTPIPLPNNIDGSNDAVALIIANFIGSQTTGHMNTIYSDNSTYEVSNAEITAAFHQSTPTPVHADQLRLVDLLSVNWTTDLVQTPGQYAWTPSQNPSPSVSIQIDPQNVGGFFTASTGHNDNSMAYYGGLAGTNLRWAEALWEVSMGLSLTQLANGGGGISIPNPVPSVVPFASPIPQINNIPAFVPEGEPNLLVGVGQPACISCHGIGGSNILHGYATLADLFDFDSEKGHLTYTNAPYVSFGPEAPYYLYLKSLGSNLVKRTVIGECLTAVPSQTKLGFPKDGSVTGGIFFNCNPQNAGASAYITSGGTISGASQTQDWDLTEWENSGFLSYIGWTGPPSGTASGNGKNGLNNLGTYIGNATLTYQFMVTRVLGEICPNSTMSTAAQNTIALNAQSADKGGSGAFDTGGVTPFGYIVASVASDPTCHW